MSIPRDGQQQFTKVRVREIADTGPLLGTIDRVPGADRDQLSELSVPLDRNGRKLAALDIPLAHPTQ